MNKRQRHAGQIAKMLSEVKGNMDEVKDSMLNQRDVTEDADLATQSWAATWDKLVNSFQNVIGTGMGEFLELLIPIIKELTDFLGMFATTLSEIPGIGAGFGALIVGIGTQLTMKSVNDGFLKNLANGLNFVSEKMTKASETGEMATGTMKKFESVGGKLGKAAGFIAKYGTAITAGFTIAATAWSFYKAKNDALFDSYKSLYKAQSEYNKKSEALTKRTETLKQRLYTSTGMYLDGEMSTQNLIAIREKERLKSRIDFNSELSKSNKLLGVESKNSETYYGISTGDKYSLGTSSSKINNNPLMSETDFFMRALEKVGGENKDVQGLYIKEQQKMIENQEIRRKAMVDEDSAKRVKYLQETTNSNYDEGSKVISRGMKNRDSGKTSDVSSSDYNEAKITEQVYALMANRSSKFGSYQVDANKQTVSFGGIKEQTLTKDGTMVSKGTAANKQITMSAKEYISLYESGKITASENINDWNNKIVDKNKSDNKQAQLMSSNNKIDIEKKTGQVFTQLSGDDKAARALYEISMATVKNQSAVIEATNKMVKENTTEFGKQGTIISKATNLWNTLTGKQEESNELQKDSLESYMTAAKIESERLDLFEDYMDKMEETITNISLVIQNMESAIGKLNVDMVKKTAGSDKEGQYEAFKSVYGNKLDAYLGGMSSYKGNISASTWLKSIDASDFADLSLMQDKKKASATAYATYYSSDEARDSTSKNKQSLLNTYKEGDTDYNAMRADIAAGADLDTQFMQIFYKLGEVLNSKTANLSNDNSAGRQKVFEEEFTKLIQSQSSLGKYFDAKDLQLLKDNIKNSSLLITDKKSFGEQSQVLNGNIRTIIARKRDIALNDELMKRKEREAMTLKHSTFSASNLLLRIEDKSKKLLDNLAAYGIRLNATDLKAFNEQANNDMSRIKADRAGKIPYIKNLFDNAHVDEYGNTQGNMNDWIKKLGGDSNLFSKGVTNTSITKAFDSLASSGVKYNAETGIVSFKGKVLSDVPDQIIDFLREIEEYRNKTKELTDKIEEMKNKKVETFLNDLKEGVAIYKKVDDFTKTNQFSSINTEQHNNIAIAQSRGAMNMVRDKNPNAGQKEYQDIFNKYRESSALILNDITNLTGEEKVNLMEQLAENRIAQNETIKGLYEGVSDVKDESLKNGLVSIINNSVIDALIQSFEKSKDKLSKIKSGIESIFSVSNNQLDAIFARYEAINNTDLSMEINAMKQLSLQQEIRAYQLQMETKEAKENAEVMKDLQDGVVQKQIEFYNLQTEQYKQLHEKVKTGIAEGGKTIFSLAKGTAVSSDPDEAFNLLGSFLADMFVPTNNMDELNVQIGILEYAKEIHEIMAKSVKESGAGRYGANAFIFEGGVDSRNGTSDYENKNDIIKNNSGLANTFTIEILVGDNSVKKNISKDKNVVLTEANGTMIVNGHAKGGKTADVGVNTIAGVVHGGEFVIPKWMVDSMPEQVAMLEAIRTKKTKGFKNGGYTTLVDSMMDGVGFSETAKVTSKDLKSTNILELFKGQLAKYGLNYTSYKTDKSGNWNLLYSDGKENKAKITFLKNKDGSGKLTGLYNGENKVGKNKIKNVNPFARYGVSDETYADGLTKFPDNGKNMFNPNGKTINNKSNNTNDKSSNSTPNNNGISSSKTSNIMTTKDFLNNGKWDGESSNVMTKASIDKVGKFLTGNGFTKSKEVDGLFENGKQWVKISKDSATGFTKLVEGAGKFNDAVKSINETLSSTNVDAETKDDNIDKRDNDKKEGKSFTDLKNDRFKEWLNNKSNLDGVMADGRVVGDGVLGKMKERWDNTKFYKEAYTYNDELSKQYSEQTGGKVKIWNYEDEEGKTRTTDKREVKDRDTEAQANYIKQMIGAIGAITQTFHELNDTSVLDLEIRKNSLEIEKALAMTKKEILALEEQEVELRIAEIEQQLKSGNSFYGVAQGGAGAVANSAVSLGMTAATLGAGPIGIAVGAIAGGIMGGIGYDKQKAQARVQESQLRSMLQIERYSKAVKESMELNNTFAETLASDGLQMGFSNAFDKQLKAVNSDLKDGTDFTGTGKSSFNYNTGGKKSKNVEEWKSSQISMTDVLTATGNGDKARMSDIGDLEKNTEIVRAYSTQKQAELQAKIDSKKLGFGGSTSTYSAAERAQFEAEKQAYADLVAEMERALATMKSIRKDAAVGYFGAELIAEKNELGEITGYYADWSSSLTDLMSTSREITKDQSKQASFASKLIDGMANLYIQNISKIDEVFKEKMESLYKTISTNMMDGLPVESQIKEMVGAMAEYKEQQKLVNAEVFTFGQTWVEQGGSIIDILDSLDVQTQGIVESFSKIYTSGSAISGLENILSSTVANMKEVNSDEVLSYFSKDLMDFSSAIQNISNDDGAISSLASQIGNMGDYLADVERYQGVLTTTFGVPQSVIDSLLATQKLEEAINEEIIKRSSNADVITKRTTNASTALTELMTSFRLGETSVTDGIENLLEQRYNEAIAKLQTDKDAVRNSIRDFTTAWMEGSVDGAFSVVSDQIDESTKSMIESFKSALTSATYAESFNQIGENIAGSIVDAYTEKMLNSVYKNQLAQVNAQMYEVLGLSESGSLNLGNASALSQEVRKLAVQMEQDRVKIQTFKDLMSSSELRLNTSENQINYQSSSTKESIYNINNYSTFEIGNLIATDSSMRQFSEAIVPFLAKAFKNAGVTI